MLRIVRYPDISTSYVNSGLEVDSLARGWCREPTPMPRPKATNYRRRLHRRKVKALRLLAEPGMTKRQVAERLKISERRLYQLLVEWQTDYHLRMHVA
jgi:hypothetical protein